MSENSDYYLGRLFDAAAGKVTDQPLLYDPDDLTTHAVVVGMTGSGKTGLCIGLLEEAALNGVPALMIDPKGDITNALLHFPELAPADFQPWIDPDQARREDKSLEQAAADTAALWRDGLTKWAIGPERIQKLADSVQFTVYTPGSDSGIPVSILASLAAPDLSWDDHRELLLEKISATVSGLLGLIGYKDVDPVRSREHILLSNLFEKAWRAGQDLSLSELIMQTQSPPFEKLGVFDVNTFFPQKDRFELAMMLNNILAAPTFQTWIEGQALDVQGLLYTDDGRPRHSIFYIAHLNDAERMFFVSLLFSAVETWMRTQTGSTSLRALMYFDEIFGYLPPIGNPPSKESMLRMLKQARAFGVGLVLATQNPVDVDYKALSNAGTWLIGKLQTDQDKQRLLDGLTGAAGGLDRGQLDALLSSLGKRVFLQHNVHAKQPALFQTRWVMNYLAGPITRNRIPELNKLAGLKNLAAASPAAAPGRQAAVPAEPAKAEIGSMTRPAVPRGIAEVFLPNNLTLSEAAREAGRSLPADAKMAGLLYRPVLFAQAVVRYLKRTYNLNIDTDRAALVEEPDRRGVVRWEDFLIPAIDTRSLDRQPAREAYFAALEGPLADGSLLNSMERDFADWIYQTSEIKVRANEELDVYAGPDVSDADFEKMCLEAAEKMREAELDKLQAAYARKIESVEVKLEREERELKDDMAEHSRRKQEEGLSHAETLFSFLGGRRRSLSSSMTKRRMTERAKDEVEESEEAIQEFEEQIEELGKEFDAEVAEVHTRWEKVARQSSEIPVQPYKKDVVVDLFSVAWFPYHVLEVSGRTVELPGFGQEK